MAGTDLRSLRVVFVFKIQIMRTMFRGGFGGRVAVLGDGADVSLSLRVRHPADPKGPTFELF